MSQTLNPESEIAPVAVIKPTTPSDLRTENLAHPNLHRVTPAAIPVVDSLFDRFAWLYVFFREKIFRDDSERIMQALWPNRNPAPETKLIELGCGPGFYSCEIATCYPAMTVLGVDRAQSQLHFAREKKWKRKLENCRFECDDVLNLSHPEKSFDVVIAARLFTVLQNQPRAISEMHRILRSGGRCLIAEPRYAFWASLPLLALWLLAAATGMSKRYSEPRKATVLPPADFEALFTTQPWRKIETWQDGRYQYALCEKA